MRVDAEMERVLSEIEMKFDAELLRQEEEAADDLAAGLRQDRLLREELQRQSSALLLHDGRRQEVTVVGRDYVGSGWPLSCVTKIERAVVALQAVGATPADRADTLLEVVRRWQRARLRVELVLEGGSSVTGMLDRVAADHVLVGGPSGPLMVAIPVVVSIRLVRGG